MADEDIQREFDQAVKRIIERIESHEAESIKRALELLERTRTQVIADIASGGSEFNLSVLRQVGRALERRIEDFRRDLDRQLRTDLNRAFDLGTDLVDEPVSVIARPLIGVSREVAQVAAEFSATLITELSDSMRSQINGVLRRAALGGLSVADAIAQVGKSLTDPSVFSSIAARAETIVRTEVLRIQAIAAQARMMQSKEAARRAGWAMKKEWLSAKDVRVRPGHLAANGQVKDVEEPFLVFVRVGKALVPELLNYPRDPAGSAANTINCRCVSRPVIDSRIYKLDRSTRFER